MTREYSVHSLHQALKKALRHGARAALLATHSPGLVELLTPHPDTDHLIDRAYLAEKIIRTSIEILPHPDTEAALTLFALDRARHTTLEARRRRAARCVGIHPDTFRKSYHEGVLLLDIASAIYENTSTESP